MSADNNSTPQTSSNTDDNKKRRRYLLAGALALLVLAAAVLFLVPPADDDPAPTPPPEVTPEPTTTEPPTDTPTTTETPTTTDEPSTTEPPTNFEYSVESSDGDKTGWTVTYNGTRSVNESTVAVRVTDGTVYGPYLWSELSTDDDNTISPGETITVTESTVPNESFNPEMGSGGIMLGYDTPEDDSNCYSAVSGFSSNNGELKTLQDAFSCTA